MSILPFASKSTVTHTLAKKSKLPQATVTIETDDGNSKFKCFDSDSDATLELNDSKDECETQVGMIFTMKDDMSRNLQDIFSVAGYRATTVKRTFYGKPVNILVDTGCDIVCVLSRITLRSEWKKVTNLKVRGFNGGIVNCLAKTDID
jgi:hypothetical protein